ncbi:MAG: efflux RND transporter periplasmic adaptor subunit, partial [Candidatus Latescibacteria bacterium]|nr:efflux RND transporter periplasmic adaptor subunit [Candidatus Latescibacterota bacterium]
MYEHIKKIISPVCIVVAVLYVNGCNKDHDTESQNHIHENESIHSAETLTDDHKGNDNTTNTHGHESGDNSDSVYEHDHNNDETYDHTEDRSLNQGEDWERLIGLKTVEASLKPLDKTISVPGEIIPNQNQVAVVSPFIESSVNEIFVNVGDRVDTGTILVCITSPEIGILRADYDKAKAELNIKRYNFDRQKKLFEEQIIPHKSFQEAELDQKVAEVQYDYAMKKLLAIGISTGEIDDPPVGHSNAIGSTIHIHAPISGIVTKRNASIGQKVGSSTELFEIINLKKVWLEANIFEKDLIKIKLGQNVNIRVSAYPKK